MKNAIRKFIFTAVPTEVKDDRTYDPDMFVAGACIVIGIALAVAAVIGKL
jgi:hypothetical protein